MPVVFKFENSLQDRRGNVLPGVTVTVYESDGITLATIYSDSDGTIPIVNSQLKTDNLGLFEFYIEYGTYKYKATITHLDGSSVETFKTIYINPQDALIDMAATNAAAIAIATAADTMSPSSIQELKDFTKYEEIDKVICGGYYSAGDGGGGTFNYVAGNFSTEVAADLFDWKYIAPTGLDGSTGAWIREDGWFIDIREFGVKIDGITDDTARINFALSTLDGLGKTLYFHSGTYLITSQLSANNVNMYGPSGTNSNSAKFVFTGTGLCLIFTGSGQSLEGINLETSVVGNSGLLIIGAFLKITNNKIEGFTNYGLRAGTGSQDTIISMGTSISAAGAYYCDVTDNMVLGKITDVVGVVGVMNDGGFPNSNANRYTGNVVQGYFDIMVHFSGTNNTWSGGDIDPDLTAGALSTSIYINGINIKFRDLYYELYIPNLLIHFGTNSFGCGVENLHFQVVAQNISSKVLDEGWGNILDWMPIGYNFAFPVKSKSNNNLIPNSHFKIWNQNGYYGPAPKNWFLSIPPADPSRVSVDTVTTHGKANSLKLSPIDERIIVSYDLISAATPFDSLQQLGTEDVRGKTIVAGVWCLSSISGLGNIKINGYGQNTHTGSGNWEFLTCMAKFDNLFSSTSVQVQLRTDTDGLPKTGDVWFSEPVAFLGTELSYPEPLSLNDSFARMSGPFFHNFPIIFPDGYTNPSIKDGNVFHFNNTSATSIWRIYDGIDSQIIYLIDLNGNTTLNHGNWIKTLSELAINMTANKVYKFMIREGGYAWEF